MILKEGTLGILFFKLCLTSHIVEGNIAEVSFDRFTSKQACYMRYKMSVGIMSLSCNAQTNEHTQATLLTVAGERKFASEALCPPPGNFAVDQRTGVDPVAAVLKGATLALRAACVRVVRALRFFTGPISLADDTCVGNLCNHHIYLLEETGKRCCLVYVLKPSRIFDRIFWISNNYSIIIFENLLYSKIPLIS